MKRSHRRWGERGQALVEFAVVSVVFFMLVFGIFDMARLFQSWVTVEHASREGARYAITGQINCTEYPTGSHRDDCIVKKTKLATTGLNGGGVSGTDITVRFKYWDYPSYAGSGATGSGSQCDQIEVKTEYTHHFVTPFLEAIFPSGIPIYGTQRMTNEPFGPCQASP